MKLSSVYLLMLLLTVVWVLILGKRAKGNNEQKTKAKVREKVNENSVFDANKLTEEQANSIYMDGFQLYEAGKIVEAIAYLENILKSYGTLALPYQVRPSLYSYYAICLVSPGINRHKEAIEAFQNATIHTPTDIYAWLNLGELSMQTFQLTKAIDILSEANKLAESLCKESQNNVTAHLDWNDCRYNSSVKTAPRLLRAMSWTNTWKNYEYFAHVLERAAKECYDSYDPNTGLMAYCQLETSGSLEYTDVSGQHQLLFESMSPDSRPKSQIQEQLIAPFWKKSNTEHLRKRKLKVGILSSDFGVHPVSSLVRGLVQFIVQGDRLDLHLFSLNEKSSYWGTNMTNLVGIDHFIYLTGKDMMTSAEVIASYGIEVLIDLNGHTMGTGLSVMSHRPAPVQLTYLGLPTSTGAAFIDYLIGDPVASPPENNRHFSEYLALLPLGHCYIANDFAQMLGDILFVSGKNRAERKELKFSSQQTPPSLSASDMHKTLNRESILVATFSSPLKTDPMIFQVWTNALRTHPRADLLSIVFQGSEGAIDRMRSIGAWAGVKPTRLLESPLLPWIDHIYAKTAVDLVLDTVVKNGHTTGLDSLWAGIPSIAMGGGNVMSNRASESIASAFGSKGMSPGMSYSLKEYEDVMSFVLAEDRSPNCSSVSGGSCKESGTSSPWRLRVFQDYQQKQRLFSNVFDTQSFTGHFERLLQSIWELSCLSNHLYKTAAQNQKKFHIFATAQNSDFKEYSKEVVQLSLEAIDANKHSHDFSYRRKFWVDQVIDKDGPPTKWTPNESVKEAFFKRFRFDPTQRLRKEKVQQISSQFNNSIAEGLAKAVRIDRDESAGNYWIEKYSKAQSKFFFKHPLNCEEAEQFQLKKIDQQLLSKHPLQVYYGEQ